MMISVVYLGRLDSTFVEDNAASRGPSSHFPMSDEGILAKMLCHLRVAVEIFDRRNPGFVVTGFHKESGFLMLQYLVQYWKIRAYYWFPAAIYSKSFIGDIQRTVFVPPELCVLLIRSVRISQARRIFQLRHSKTQKYNIFGVLGCLLQYLISCS